MPTALETLVKILKQERESGCENKIVIGGLSGYGKHWFPKAKSEARHPERMVLVEELLDIISGYDALKTPTERLKQVDYMLNRITGRAPLPATYSARLEAIRQTFAKPAPASDTPPTEGERQDRKDKHKPRPTAEEQAPRQEREQRRENAPRERDAENRPAKEQQPPNRRDNRPKTTADAQRSKPPRVEARKQEKDDSSPFFERRLPDAFAVEFRPINVRPEPDLKPMPKLSRPPRMTRPPLSPEDAQARLAELHQPVTQLKGVGAKVAESLEPLGIRTILNMMHYLPKRFDDYTRMLTINRLVEGETVAVLGTVKFTQVRVGQNGRRDFHCVLEDNTGKLNVTFFAMHFLASKIRVNDQIVVSGKVGVFRGAFQMANPEWEPIDSENLHTIGLIPVYRLTEGLKPRQFRRTMKQAIEAWSERMPDYMPSATLERCDLADLGWTIRNLHFPQGYDHLEHARRRYAFDELLLTQLSILANRREWQGVPADALHVDDGFLEDFVQAVFPYPLTRAQERAIMDIRQDIAKPIPMNRLIQGDVGSGKTAVAMTAMAMAVHNGKQAALMSPTSILAEQHYRNVSRLFERYPAEQKPVIGLLTSALTASEREAIYRGLADGSIDIIIGTHALIQEGVNFHDLGVVVIDEQHRFGVEQRALLRGKGKNPHLLVMTATPIPRTLALTMYADLDLSIIDEKPAGRLPIRTRIVLPAQRYKMYEFIEAHLNEGRQAFIINPLVEPSESVDARSAKEAYEEMVSYFHRHRVCLLHGRMKPSEKDEIMGAFARHEYDIMVTTTVAEVGVDVPNANIILIDGANRFGLAQLHQLRGRVGRGEYQSFCLLMVEDDVFSPDQLLDNNLTAERIAQWNDTQRRVYAMVQTDDGFQLAELDWKLRGAGDLLGTRQSGGMKFLLAEYITPELVSMAQREAQTIFAEDPFLELPQHHLLKQRVQMLTQDKGDVS
jgi:ATP-dependent DNA helicase RecG